MKSSKSSRPSPALVLAALALVFAMVGTAVAGPDAISDKITKPKVKKISKKQANKQIDKREADLSVANADNLGGEPASAYALSESEAYREIGATGQPAFENGWANFNPTTWSTAAFYIDSLGVVHLKGTLTGGASGTTAFTLPEGYRPALNLETPMGAAGSTVSGYLFIRSTGEVEPVCSAACDDPGIDGITFRAGA